MAGTRGDAGRVVFVVDVFTDYNEPHIGLAAIEVLELSGYEVIVPEIGALGRPQLSKGLVREAKALAETNVELLAPFAAEGLPIVGIEPSEILTLTDEYPDLVPERLRTAAREIAGATSLVEVFVGRELAAGRIHLPFETRAERVLVHGHCHQKALIGNEPVLAALRQLPGRTVEAIPSGCCGMAGSFGYEHYELSMQIGELVLFPAVRAASAETVLVAPGTSCRHQIHDGTKQHARHPMEVIRDAIDLPRG